ncbi:aminoacyl-tRNA hydrolase [Candidatus Roizmanbacteria bacterium]|nr:aminoacyl-tRNA hydrolase [Candidatus Roizmanbacteria bacterium]
MILIVGLGNPGKKYQNNRHNVGHMFIDYLLKNPNDKSQITNEFQNPNFKFLKTDCYMNQSGSFFKKTLHVTHYTLHDLIVVHDDLDIPLGKFHIQKGVGPQLHNGLESIEQNLKSKDFWRIRIGVDARNKERWINGETYVLDNFLNEEKNILEMEVFPKIYPQLIEQLKDPSVSR